MFDSYAYKKKKQVLTVLLQIIKKKKLFVVSLHVINIHIYIYIYGFFFFNIYYCTYIFAVSLILY